MRRIVHKVFFVWQFDREEAWLNQMAAKGFALVSVGFCKYEFEDCEPGEYVCRLELLEHAPCHMESQKYIAFLEETGAEMVGSYMRWCYFRKKRVKGEFQLFSDFDSRISHLTRIQYLLLPLLLLNISVGCTNVSIENPINVAGGCLNLLLSVWLGYGMFWLGRKKKRLKKERQISEG